MAGVAAPSHDFDLMHSERGVLLEEGEQDRESRRWGRVQGITIDGR